MVVQWERPKHEEDLLGYYVDCCVAGSNVWEPCNHKPIGYNRCGRPCPHPPPPSEAGEAQPRTRALGLGRGDTEASRLQASTLGPRQSPASSSPQCGTHQWSRELMNYNCR